jgi:hypothetical protein
MKYFKAKILILIAFILMPISTFPGERDVDSLKSILSTAEGKDRVKIQISLMEEIQRSAPYEAINIGNEALDILKASPESQLDIEVLYIKGWAYLYLNELRFGERFTQSKLVELKSQRTGMQQRNRMV